MSKRPAVRLTSTSHAKCRDIIDGILRATEPAEREQGLSLQAALQIREKVRDLIQLFDQNAV